MKHAGPASLAKLSPLLEHVRRLGSVLTERKPGTFYLRSSAFLHFHEDPQGLFADIKLNGTEFSRFPINSLSEQDTLLSHIAEALARAAHQRAHKA